MTEVLALAVYGYAGLFITSFLASTVLPLGSEALLLLLINKGYEPIFVIMIASVGNYCGACTTYYIGLVGRKDIIEKHMVSSQQHLINAEKWFTKYGAYSLLFTWVPVIGDAITAMGGIMRLDFKTFSVFVLLGKLLRYISVTCMALELLS
ncbi:YqaA family protein [Methanomethylovorans sp.]|uniref:YqaA family protein n=1 Tax=Methanomethylovorans sp. TaxID=2758717 RepID=UPI000AEA7312|nr:YqaA family protein [Methanomethylovorans sp.]